MNFIYFLSIGVAQERQGNISAKHERILRNSQNSNSISTIGKFVLSNEILLIFTNFLKLRMHE